MNELSGKRVAILVEDLYNDLEFWYPKIRLTEAGADVMVLGPTAGATYTSKYGIPAVADMAFADLRADSLQGLLVPGGYAPDRIRRSNDALALVKDTCTQNKPLAFICHAGWVLVSAGVLKGRRCTSFIAIKDDMVNAGCQWEDAAVVVDGNLISSRTPDDLPQFCAAFIDLLQGS
jgi:protease I